jgi:WD40 repeat protein
LYDSGRAKPLAIKTDAGPNAPVHNNRVFAVKYNNTEPFTVYSASWDNTILLWDMRTKLS